MILIFSLLFAGFFAGFVLKKYKNFIKIADKSIMYIIYFLLFSIGINVGTNQTIISNFNKIGINALILTLGAAIGTITISGIVYIYIFKKMKK